MPAYRRCAVPAILCLLVLPALARAQGGLDPSDIPIEVGAAQTITFNCPPGMLPVDCFNVENCGVPIGTDHFPPDLLFVPLSGKESASVLGRSVLATHAGFLPGLNLLPVQQAGGLGFLAFPTLSQITYHFNYSGPLSFTSNYSGYTLSGQNLGNAIEVTLTAQPGAALLGSLYKPNELIAFNLRATNPANPAGQAFLPSTLTVRAGSAALTPEPNAAALLGGFALASGIAFRRRCRRA